jgi:hypothetical protein
MNQSRKLKKPLPGDDDFIPVVSNFDDMVELARLEYENDLRVRERNRNEQAASTQPKRRRRKW